MIKAENAHDLAHVDAKDLILYKVSLSNTDSKATPAVTRIHLQALEEIQEVFPEPLQKSHVHIIFEHASVFYRYHSLTRVIRRIYSS